MIMHYAMNGDSCSNYRIVSEDIGSQAKVKQVKLKCKCRISRIMEVRHTKVVQTSYGKQVLNSFKEVG